MRKVVIGRLRQEPVEDQLMEMVERKGKGHPDYICDAIMDKVSVRLCQEYIKRFGYILHHNIDKALLAAGESEVRFGGGLVKKPMLLVFGDRATASIDGEDIPLDEIVVSSAREWIRENLRFVDPEEHVRYQVELKQGSASLVDIFKRGGEVLGANDTSAAVGYAPMTKTEKLTLGLERFLNSEEFKKSYEETGEDIKVMSCRVKNEVSVMVAMAFVDRFIPSEGYYFRLKEKILEEIEEFMEKSFDFGKIHVEVNTLDTRGRGEGGIYLTVLGTSADSGDSGQVGRGNRVNGVIPLNRPVSSEAAAGKNPVSHVGKIYNALTYEVAREIYEEVSGLREVYVWLLSRIGDPIDRPFLTAVQVIPEKGLELGEVRGDIEEVVNRELDDIAGFCNKLARGEVSLF